jgi:hypothetical protein
MRILQTTLISLAIFLLGGLVVYNFMPYEISPLGDKLFGATITTIQGTDKIKDSRAIINTNFANLNTDKLEISDFLATTSLPQITTLSNLVTVGNITSGTWTSTDIGVAYGGTGASTLTASEVLLGNGTSAIQTVSAGSNDQILTLVGGVPTWQSGSIDESLDYDWTGANTFTGDVTMASTTITATSTLNNVTIESLILEGVDTSSLVVGSTTDASSLHYHAGNCEVGNGTKAANITGTENIAHSLGVTPSFLQIRATRDISGTVRSGLGIATSASDERAMQDSVLAVNTGYIIYLDAAVFNVRLTALSSTNFTLDFIANANDGDTTYYMWTICK